MQLHMEVLARFRKYCRSSHIMKDPVFSMVKHSIFTGLAVQVTVNPTDINCKKAFLDDDQK